MITDKILQSLLETIQSVVLVSIKEIAEKDMKEDGIQPIDEMDCILAE